MRRLLLIGGGHAHLEVLRLLGRRPLAGTEVMLLSPEPVQAYSSMIPGYLRRQFAAEELTFDLRRLARHARATFIAAPARSVDGGSRTVRTRDRTVEFDVASLDVGSAPAGLDVPGVREHAFPVRPWGAVRILRQRLDALLDDGGPAEIIVVGGGAGGVEVALAVGRRARDRGPGVSVRLVERGDLVLPDFTSGARRLALEALARTGVRVYTGSAVERVAPDAVHLAGGEHVAATLTIWVPGAAAPPLVRASPLPRDADGYLLVDAFLRALDGGPVYGAGDCISMTTHPALPKAGVYPVRQAPVLAHNLRAALVGDRPRAYVPQQRSLALLDTADGGAVLRYGRLAGSGALAGWLKRRIDRRFMHRYQRLSDDGQTSPP